jgi:adenylate cyclase
VNEMTTTTRLAVILHADVVGSTALVQTDERLAHDRIVQALRSVSAVVTKFGGTTHEIRGDALVAEFGRASDAVCAALVFQAANGEANATLSGDVIPLLRVGIALGEVVIADGTVTGAGVILAQRLEQESPAGGVVVQGAIAEAVPARLPVTFEFLGEKQLKGFAHGVRAYRVQANVDADLSSNAAGRSSAVCSPVRPNVPRTTSPALVLRPFRFVGTAGEHEYIAAALTQSIGSALAHFREYRIVEGDSAEAVYALEGVLQIAGARDSFRAGQEPAGHRPERDIDVWRISECGGSWRYSNGARGWRTPVRRANGVNDLRSIVDRH